MTNRAILSASLLLISMFPAQAQYRPTRAGYNYGFTANNYSSSPYYTSYNSLSFGTSAYANGYGYGFNPYYAATQYATGGYVSGTSYISNRYGTWASNFNTGYSAHGTGYGGFGYGYYGPGYFYGGVPAFDNINPNPPVAAAAAAAVPVRSNEYVPNMKYPGSQSATRQEPVKVLKSELKPKVFTEKDILSGEAINAVIDELIDSLAKGRRIIKAETVDLAAINFQSGKSAGQYAYLLLEDAGKIPWAESLTNASAETKTLQDKIQKGFDAILAAHRKEKPVVDAAHELRKEVQQLSDQISAQIRDLGLPKYAEAKNALKNLDITLQFLQETPDYQSWKHGLKAKTDAEMARLFTENHLRIAPAMPGTEKAYQSLYAALKKTSEQLSASAILE